MNFFGGGGRKRETSSHEVAPEKTDMMAGDMSAGMPYSDSSSTNFAATDNSAISSNVTLQQPALRNGRFRVGQRRDAAADGSSGTVSAAMLPAPRSTQMSPSSGKRQSCSKLFPNSRRFHSISASTDLRRRSHLTSALACTLSSANI